MIVLIALLVFSQETCKGRYELEGLERNQARSRAFSQL